MYEPPAILILIIRYSWLPFAPPLTSSRTLNTKVSVDTIVQLFYSLTSGLIAIDPDAR
jgi:hypothetical protein